MPASNLHFSVDTYHPVEGMGSGTRRSSCPDVPQPFLHFGGSSQVEGSKWPRVLGMRCSPHSIQWLCCQYQQLSIDQQ